MNDLDRIMAPLERFAELCALAQVDQILSAAMARAEGGGPSRESADFDCPAAPELGELAWLGRLREVERLRREGRAREAMLAATQWDRVYGDEPGPAWESSPIDSILADLHAQAQLDLASTSSAA